MFPDPQMSGLSKHSSMSVKRIFTKFTDIIVRINTINAEILALTALISNGVRGPIVRKTGLQDNESDKQGKLFS